MMITSLTIEQEGRFKEYVDKWTALGLSTEPANRSEAEAAIKLAYECAKLEPPKKFVWCDSPLSLHLVYELAKRPSKGRTIEDIRKTLSEIKNASLSGQLYGSHDAGWLSFYDYFREVCSLEKETELLQGLTKLAQHAGWCIPCQDVCFLSERHNVLNRDDQGRLHCEDGPAVAYPDGFEIYSWHGIEIPAEWITRKGHLTAETVLNWSNIEQRRCAAEIIGWDKVLEQLSPQVLDQATPSIGTLLRVDLPGSPGEKFLKVQCGTGRTFVLAVPQHVTSAIEANAWTYDVPVEVIQELEART